jgi:hypothetical protein
LSRGIYRRFSNNEEFAAEAFDYTWEAAWNARWLGHKSAAKHDAELVGKLRQH